MYIPYRKETPKGNMVSYHGCSKIWMDYSTFVLMCCISIVVQYTHFINCFALHTTCILIYAAGLPGERHSQDHWMLVGGYNNVIQQ